MLLPVNLNEKPNKTQPRKSPKKPIDQTKQSKNPPPPPILKKPPKVKPKQRAWFKLPRIRLPKLRGYAEPIGRPEVYYFEHAEPTFFHTTDFPPPLSSETLADQTTIFATKFWAEVFGVIDIGLTFVVAFVLQLYRFLLNSLVRQLVIGLIRMTSDYLLKPFLAILFNGGLQPLLILARNVFAAIRDAVEPLAGAIGHFLRPLAEVLRSIRVVEINKRQTETRDCSLV